MIKKYFSKEFRRVVLAYFFVLIALIIAGIFIEVPLMSTDEAFYINYARCFAGIKLDCLNTGVPYGYSFFLIPFVFINDVFIQYHVILLFNAFFVSLLFFISYYFFRICKKNSFKVSILLSLCISFFPGFFLIGKTVMTESVFIVLVTLNFVLFYVALNRPKMLLFFILGLNSFLIYLVRDNGLFISCLMVLSMLVLAFKGYKKPVLWFFLGFFIFEVFDLVIRKVFFVDSMGNYGVVFTRTLSAIQSFDWIQNIMGNLFYISLATFLIVPIFLLKYLTSFKKEFNYANFIYVMAFLINLIVISAILVGGDRADYHMYGRYLVAFMGPVLLLALDYVVTAEKKQVLKQFILAFLFSIVFFLLMENLGAYETIHCYNVFSFSWVFLSFKTHFLYPVLLIFIPISFLVFLSLFKKKYLGFILAVFIINSLLSYYFYFYTGSLDRRLSTSIVSYANENNLIQKSVYFDPLFYDPYVFHVYRYFFPDFLRGAPNYDICSANSDLLISGKENPCANSFLLTFENHADLALYTFDKDLYEKLREERKVVPMDRELLNQNLLSDIEIVSDKRYLFARNIKVKIKNNTDEVWISYWASRNSKYEPYPISIREYWYLGDNIVNEKRKYFDYIMFPGDEQVFSYWSFKPICTKLELSVVQDGYSVFKPKLDIILK